jgi:hypothetical protein
MAMLEVDDEMLDTIVQQRLEEDFALLSKDLTILNRKMKTIGLSSQEDDDYQWMVSVLASIQGSIKFYRGEDIPLFERQLELNFG